MTKLNLIVALQATEKLGEKTLLKLLREFPEVTVDDVLNNPMVHKILKYKAVIEKVMDIDYLNRKLIEADKFINEHNKNGIDIISIHSSDYPELLKLLEDPPILLYCKGNKSLLEKYKNIAVIGTREPTAYGEMAAKKIARIFANEGYTIVSGLAKGIDTFGHLGALEANNGKTIAVLAGSLDRIYPAENKELAETILLNEGLLISEIGLGQKTNRGSFVKRDRIQSGLSLGVCPIQAPLKSGTHHTINYARLQKRLVFCPTPVEGEEVEATQGIYNLMKDDNVFVLSSKECYIKLYNLLDQTGKLLLKEKYDENSKLLLEEEFELQLEIFLKQGVKTLGELKKVEEIINRTVNKLK